MKQKRDGKVRRVKKKVDTENKEKTTEGVR